MFTSVRAITCLEKMYGERYLSRLAAPRSVSLLDLHCLGRGPQWQMFFRALTKDYLNPDLCESATSSASRILLKAQCKRVRVPNLLKGRVHGLLLKLCTA